MSTGSSWTSIWTDMVKRSFNRPYQTLCGLSTNRSTPGGRVNTKSSRLYPCYVMFGKGQHWRRWIPTCIVWPICNVPNIRRWPSPYIIAYYYQFQHIIITIRRRSKCAMSTGRSMACTSKRLRSEGSGGN